MENTEDNKPTPRYWQSLEQWRQDPEFLKIAENEFKTSPLNGNGTVTNEEGWARREFLKLMGASLALTTFGCVRRPAQKIIPYAKKPYDVVHGYPNFYASSYVDGLEGIGTLVTTRDGRPIKIEGNDEHPANAGGMSARAHAHILKLYDPDRFTSAKRNLQNKNRTNRETISVKWEDLDKDVLESLKKGKVAVLMASSLSPATNAVVEDFSSAFGAKVYSYDEISYAPLMQAQKASYGQAALPRYNVEKAKYILTVNNDFLGTWLTPVAFNRQFSKARKADAGMAKLVSIESLFSMTGSNADERFRIKPNQTLDVIMGLIHEIVVVKKQSRYSADHSVGEALSQFEKNKAALGFDLGPIAEELWKNRGQSLVLAGGLMADTVNAHSLYVATNFLNSILENDGKTIDGSGANILNAKSVKLGMSDLINAMNSKQVGTLIIHGCNPAYSLPAVANFADAMKNVEMVVYTGDRNDETARFADYLACDHHPMENWGDMQSYDGVVSIQQPTIRPLYDTRAFQDSLLAWAKGGGKISARAKNAATWYDYLNAYWKESVYPSAKKAAAGKSFDDWWVDVLQSGVVNNGKNSGGSRSLASASLGSVKPNPVFDGYQLALYANVAIGDSNLANVPWLQELPDPVSKIVWDNYASVSVKDAKALGLKEGQKVRLTVGNQSLDVAAHIQPGQADGVIGLAVGYGRQGAGKVADGVGVNAWKLASWSNGERVTAGLKCDVKVLSETNRLACTQDHHSMEGRQIVVEETLQDFIKNPGGSVERTKLTTMWSGHKYPGHKWGMTIDLNSCTGCGSCVIACQSENNIPTVGKENVLTGREMHWIRIDRYYTGTPENPGLVNQPLLCMHCDNAPCETVCPVAATVHGDEGTNDMIYNRCVGTRYCSNNCPYKVRRFNWFNYTAVPEPRNMALNPEVTQRFRGVMEKCTFCTHRIHFNKMKAKVEKRTLKDGDFTVACAQSCPTSAITFGDLHDKDSAVAKQFDAPASYSLLEELNTRPAVHYQVKVRNAVALNEPVKHKSKEHGPSTRNEEQKS